jgi:demethylmenaquinone methyltransferase/2-methoxy-6-polyprenyl-1,4-benzoquinol methylase
MVPLAGRIVTGDAAAYAYLPASVEAFPRAEGLARIMAAAGLVKVRYRRFGLGAVAIHVGETPGALGRTSAVVVP